MKNLYFLFLFLFSFVTLFSQENKVEKPEIMQTYGVYGNYNMNFHNADFRKLGDIPNCCPTFESGDGKGFTAGILFEQPLSETFFFGLRANYSTGDGILKHTEDVTFGVQGNRIPGKIGYTIDSKIASAGIEPLIGIKFLKNFQLFIGARVGYVTTKTFKQEEKITEPTSGVEFLDSSSIYWNRFSGDIPNANSISVAGVIGISYDIALNRKKTFLISPEVSFAYGIIDVAKGTTWKVSSARAGLAFKYRYIIFPFKPEIKPAEPPMPNLAQVQQPPPEPPAPPLDIKPALNASITAVGVEPDGNETTNFKIFKIEEFLSTNVQPLLSYIFFDENSSNMPARLSQLIGNETKKFSAGSLRNLDALETYHHVLNILALRMNQYPEAKITLTGCNSDNGPEKGNQDLSRRRAKTIADYLINVWKIDPARINITARNLPEKPSNPNSADGMEENRRVEISTTHESLLDPVVSTDTLRDVNPPTARFKSSITSEAGVKSWKITITNNGNPIQTYSGTGDIPAMKDWQITKDLTKAAEVWSSVEYQLEVVDNKGQKIVTPIASLPISTETIKKKREEKKTDKQIDRYSLILFDFNSAELTSANQKIANMIKPRIKPEATVSVYGYADRSGNPKRNEQLAKERAVSSSKAIERPDANIYPIGSSKLLYDNDSPEGRFYSRTVSITVETPINTK
jgi:outer membrane protein OmpA-like peptidoglycan-associated protein